MQRFRIRGLPADEFRHLFALSDSELEEQFARRMVADGAGNPCRVSLSDAQSGDALILVNYEHHRVVTLYRSAFAIFVREGEQQFDAIDQIPDQLRKRVLSLRGYDKSGMLQRAELVEGQQAELGIHSVLAHHDVAYVHAHFAKHGCYAALIERA
jgi:Protein of unknown function (DUF1203)